MSTILGCNVLSTEITAIPTWIRTILGSHYNNTLCNGATWMLVFWRLLHIVYNKLMLGYLKQIGTKKYICVRLTRSIWFLGFFSSALCYYLVTLDINKLQLLRGSRVTLNENLPIQVILAYSVISTFYLHTAFSEGIQMGSLHRFLKYILLVAVCTSAYIVRFLEIPFGLSALIGISAISEELTRIFYSVLSQDNTMNYIFVRTLYIFSLVFFSLIHLIIIPLIFLVPLGGRIISEDINSILLMLFSCLVLWLGTTIYNSILLNSIFHWLYHTKEELSQEDKLEEEGDDTQKVNCPGNLIECSVFSNRTDDAYVLYCLRSEINERKLEMVARRKPKSRNMIIQTLKCMMMIKKKLSEKYKSESSQSDDEETDKDIEEEDDSDSEVKIEELKEENKNDFHKCIEGTKELQNEEGTITGETNIKTMYFNVCDSENIQRSADCDGEEKDSLIRSDEDISVTGETCKLASETEEKHIAASAEGDKVNTIVTNTEVETTKQDQRRDLPGDEAIKANRGVKVKESDHKPEVIVDKDCRINKGNEDNQIGKDGQNPN